MVDIAQALVFVAIGGHAVLSHCGRARGVRVLA